MATVTNVASPDPHRVRLELTVEYDGVADAMDETKDLIERARQGGFVLRATLFNLPPTIAIV